ncbi:hypothetical protein BH11ARM2_BH11ARM2_24910 [soil metagenome]
MKKVPKRSPPPIDEGLDSFVKALVDDSREIVSVVDAKLRFIAFSEPYSDEFEATWGVRPQRGQSLEELLNRLPETFHPVKKDWERALAGERHRVLERVASSDRSVHRYEVEFRPVLGRDGETVGAIQTARMMTQAQAKREAKERLVEGEALYRTLIEHSCDVVFSLSQEGILNFVSPAWEKIMGTPAEDATDVRFEVFVHPDDLAAWRGYVSGMIEGTGSEDAIEHRARTVEGPWRIFSTRLALVKGTPGEPLHLVGTAVDLTERVLAEEAVRASERRFRAFVDQATVGIAHVDMDGKFILVNDRYCELVGRTREQLQGAGPADITHADDRATTLSMVERLRRTGQPFEDEKRYVMPNGSAVWVNLRVSLVVDEAGRPLFTQGIVIDVTKRVIAEAALRRQLATTQAIADNADSALLLLDSRGRISQANLAFYRLTNLSEGKAIGFSARALLRPRKRGDRPKAEQAPIDGSFVRGTPLHRHEDLCSRQDGTSFPIVLSFTPILNEEGKPSGGVLEFRDVTAEKEAERELLKREQRFRFLAEAIPLPIWTGDPLGRLTFVNHRWRDLYQVEDVVTPERVLAIIHPEDLPILLSAAKQAIELEHPFSTRCRLLVAGEGYRWHLLSATPEFSDDVLTEWIGTNVDLHDEIDRERALELTARVGQALAEDLNLERIVHALTDAALEVTEASYGAFFWAAEGEEEAFSLYTRAEAKEAFEQLGLPQAASSLGLDSPSGEIVRLCDATIDARFALPGSTDAPLGPLPVRSFLAVPVASRLTPAVGLIVLGHTKPDLFTEKHEQLLAAFAAQAAIALDNARLYKDQARMNEELVSARDDALSSSRAKSEFLANMSHEIRTPLNGVIGMASLLGSLDLDEEARSMVGTIASSGETLLRVLDEVLDLARIDAGRMEIERAPTEIAQVIADVAALYQGNAFAKGISIVCYPPPEPMPLVKTDALRLRQALSNILSNAVKFTHAGLVELSWEWSEVDGGVSMALTVRDTGIGIPSSRLASVFESFTQADGSIQRKYGGTGLGLAITKRLVDLMGGSISVRSEVGMGTTFRIALTFEIATIGVSTPEAASEVQLAGLQVLLAEDNPVNVLVAKSILERCGCVVDVAEDGLRAIAMANARAYDLVLMDLQMPLCDGLEATRVLRATEARRGSARLPIVALTANAMESDRRATVEAGMDDFIAKPVTLKTMNQLLERVKERRV